MKNPPSSSYKPFPKEFSRFEQLGCLAVLAIGFALVNLAFFVFWGFALYVGWHMAIWLVGLVALLSAG